MTTARENIEEELETRLLVTLADESYSQSRVVITAQARRAAGEGPERVSDAELAKWRALQTCLRLGPREVVVPFAAIVAEHTDLRQVRIRRDFPGLMSLTKASALLHRFQRQTDSQGRIVAEVYDYALAVAALGEGLEELARGETATIDAVRSVVAEVLREKRQHWRCDLFMGAFRAALCKRLAATGHMHIVERLGRARQAGAGETVDDCQAILAKAGAPIDGLTRHQLYRDAARVSLQESRKLDSQRPTYVELATRKLADKLGIGHKAARVRLTNALEAGVVVEVQPGDNRPPVDGTKATRTRRTSETEVTNSERRLSTR